VFSGSRLKDSITCDCVACVVQGTMASSGWTTYVSTKNFASTSHWSSHTATPLCCTALARCLTRAWLPLRSF
jgi:hypothetical protein